MIEKLLHITMINGAIALVLCVWILAVYGYGFFILKILEHRFPSLQIIRAKSTQALFLLIAPIVGMFALCFGIAVWHIFLPLYQAVSIVLLLVGIGFFITLQKHFIVRNILTLLGALFALAIVIPLSAFSDSVGDSVNYHIQIVTWIQESPLVFGLGNVHTRLGYNGLIYNFYALTDVSQIIPNLRSFIGNEVMYFSLLFSAFLVLLNLLAQKSMPKLYELLFPMALFPFLFVMKWGEFRGLYCEGIGVVLGVATFSLLLFIFDESPKKSARALFALAIIIALFSTMIKIANFALILAVALCFVVFYKKETLTKNMFRFYGVIALFSVIFILPWVIKGLATSGMIAYPASIGFFTSLPWAVSEQMRDTEVCWIMSWARAPMKDCREVLADSAWMIDWFSMQTRYFQWYFKYFVYTFFLALAVAATARILSKRIESGFALVFSCALLGIVYWFMAGPDPRFGMVYIIPSIALLLAYILRSVFMLTNPCESPALSPATKRYALVFFAGFALCLIPMFLNGRNAFVIIWVVLLALVLWGRTCHKSLLLLWLFGLGSVYGVANFYRHDFYAIAEYPKIRAVHLQERLSDSGLLVFVRTDSPTEHSKEFFYEARPMTPYFDPALQKGEFLGREMYFILHDKKQQEAQK